MNTAAAALQAGVTVGTIRTWCRNGVITAVKAFGRWIIDTTSLTRRIAIAAYKTRKATMTEPATPDLTPISRADFESAATALPYGTAVKDVRCYNEYRSYQAIGEPYADTPQDWLMIRRGATLAAEGYVRPERRPVAYECPTCGLDTRTCDCR